MAQQERRTRKLPERDLRTDRRRVGEKVDAHHRPSHGGARPNQQGARPITDDRAARRPVSHERSERRRAGTPWWIWLLGLLLVGLVAFMIFQGMDSETSTAPGDAGVELGTGDGTATGGGGTASGTVSSGGVDLLPLSSDGNSLAGYEEQAVQGTSAPIQSVVGDETFWVGQSESQRLFVFLNLQGETGPRHRRWR